MRRTPKNPLPINPNDLAPLDTALARATQAMEQAAAEALAEDGPADRSDAHSRFHRAFAEVCNAAALKARALAVEEPDTDALTDEQRQAVMKHHFAGRLRGWIDALDDPPEAKRALLIRLCTASNLPIP